MRIETSHGNEITNLEDWAKLYDTPQSSRQWKVGRSAHSTAEFFLNKNGAQILQDRVSEAIGTSFDVKRIVPEYEVRFDNFGRGRMHDLGIFGTTTGGQSVFVGVEAKVDETFGASVRDTYLTMKAKQITGATTNAPKRIEKLLAMHFQAPNLSMFDIRYQLLYATAGTIAAGADISVLFIAVFKTALYNESIGVDNYRDYIQFIGRVGGTPLQLPNKKVQGHELVLQGKRLVCLHAHFEL
jgi:hypothetical protein